MVYDKYYVFDSTLNLLYVAILLLIVVKANTNLIL